jgi:lysophospholipase L1-like esterase
MVYHSIGVNGAKFKHYLAAGLFVDQTAALAPDLVILSLGTNEALDYPYFDPQFSNQLDSLIERLRAKNPNAKILLTTPPDSYRRKTRRNPGVEIIGNKITTYADLHNLAYWDLYQVGGGNHSADFWKKYRLMRFDGIHFTVNGYALQGNLLYDALMKGYNEYVQYRHP